MFIMNRSRHPFQLRSGRIAGLFALLLTAGAPLAAQPGTVIQALLDDAAARFDIPRSVLYGISYNESRWIDLPPDSLSPSCSGMPPSIGIMGLRDDDYFGHSMASARAIGITPEEARVSIEKNILAGAYHLSTLFDGTDRNDFRQWLSAIGKYPGIPEPELRTLYIDGVMELLRHGWLAGNASVAPRPDLPSVDRKKLLEDLDRIGLTAGSPDYPDAQWQPSPNFSGRGGSSITAVTIHDTEGGFAGSVSWLRNTASEASAHYIVRSVDGFIVQMVSEADKAWHVRNENPYTIGIEHEGFAARPEYYTPALYTASARLTRNIIDRYHIPLDRTRVKGHLDFPDNTHTDPGGWWDWPGYYRLISGSPAARVVIDPFEDNVVGWWQPSMSGSTAGVDAEATTFSIAPRAAFTGTNGAELAYRFTEASGGLARVFRSGHGNTSDGLLNVGAAGAISLAVNGDASGHELEIWLYDNAKNNLILRAGAITWSGWRTLSIPLNALGAAGAPYRFHSIVLRQSAGKGLSGSVAFDDLAHTVAVAGVDEAAAGDGAVARKIALSSSQPLPPALRALGALRIYSSLGEEVASFEHAPDAAVGDYLNAGVYMVRSDGEQIMVMVGP